MDISEYIKPGDRLILGDSYVIGEATVSSQTLDKCGRLQVKVKAGKRFLSNGSYYCSFHVEDIKLLATTLEDEIRYTKFEDFKVAYKTLSI